MSLKEQLAADLKDAMKNKDTIRKNVVQLIRSGVLQIEKDKKITLDDEGVLDVIAKQLKQRRDSLPDYEKSGREDLIAELKTDMPTYTEVTGTLSSGTTSITLSSAAILETSTIDIYTDNAQVAPENAVVVTGGGSIVLTFEAQESALGVKVRVWG